MNNPEDNRVIHFALRLLRWFCPDHLFEEIEGDLIQRFNQDLIKLGGKKARRRFVWNVIRFFRPGIILRNNFSFELNQMFMLKSYLVVASRSLVKNKLFSLINILGLSVGITAFILISLYVKFEFSYDDFHNDSQNIYRVATKVTLQNEVINHESSTYEGIILALKDESPEVKALTVISPFTSDGTFIRYEDARKNTVPIETYKGYYADAGFFSVFSFPLSAGNSESVLKHPYSVVISETLASYYFPNGAVGKVLEFKNDNKPATQLTITGVVKDTPANAHFQFDMIIHLPVDESNFENGKPGFWDWSGHTYMLLNSHADINKIENRLDKLAHVNNGLKSNKDDYGQVSTFHLQPLTDIHLFSHLDYELENGGNSVLVYALLVLGLIIVVIALVNYINLSTAMSIQKVKEIGIRKVIGASKMGLILQVLTESAFFNVLSLLFAILLSWRLLPVFSDLIGAPIPFLSLTDPQWWLAGICFIVISTFLSGGYPAWIITVFRPVSALRDCKEITLTFICCRVCKCLPLYYGSIEEKNKEVTALF